jgi:hypothetical protein
MWLSCHFRVNFTFSLQPIFERLAMLAATSFIDLVGANAILFIRDSAG